MKNKLFVMTLLGGMLTSLSSCSIIGDIFKAGMGFGVFLVIIIVIIIALFIGRMWKNKK
jgi:hypothetical protein